jgi:long-subunit fatty acid transport protein
MKRGGIKMSTSKIFGFVLLLLLQISWSQSADEAIRIRQGEIGFGARSLGMGGNGVVTADDYSAIYWNPAGLAAIRKTQVTGEFSHLNFGNNATFADNFNEMNNSYTRFRNIGIAVPFPTKRGSLVFAFGYNFVKDFDEYLFFNGFNTLSNSLEFEMEDANGVYNIYPFDRDVFQTEEVNTSGGLHQWSFGGAVAVSPNLDLGATLNIWNGREEFTRQFIQEDTEDYYNVFPADFDRYTINDNLVTSFKAANLKLGGMLKLNRATRLGFAMEFPTTFDVTEEYASSDELVFDDGYVDAIDYEPGTWTYKVKTPYRFDTGIGFQLENIYLAGGITYQDWRQTRYQKPDDLNLDTDYSSLLSENRIIQKNYRQTINYHLGTEVKIPNSNMFIRGGYAYYPSPLLDAPADHNKRVYSGGVGFKIGYNTYLDVTYLHGKWSRESEDIYTPGGTVEDINENRLFLGIRFEL